MNLKVEIKRNSDGKIATYVYSAQEWNEYWWRDGNASCDCNRELFFLSALGEEEPEDTECGETRFSVRCSDNDTGEILYNEFNQS